jgi:hypothetical protein
LVEEDNHNVENQYNSSSSAIDNKWEGNENKQDTNKVTAAAGGAYDAEDDLLHIVLEAAIAFLQVVLHLLHCPLLSLGLIRSTSMNDTANDHKG